MAESAVSYLVHRLETLLGEEAELSQRIYQREVSRIRADLESMRSFLSDEDARADWDEGQRPWVQQVKEIAHRIEDAHDEPMGDGFNGFLQKTARFIKHLKARYQIATGNVSSTSMSMDSETEDDLDRKLTDMLLSYKSLPYFLKSCFLYFSLFPKNYAIKRVRLLRLWIAEGFIVENKDETLEDIAEDYLNKLIGRNLIQVAEVKAYGRVDTCSVNVIMREIIASKARGENLFSSFLEQNTTLCDKVRRLSIYKSNEIVPNYESLPCLRSLLIFQAEEFLKFPVMLSPVMLSPVMSSPVMLSFRGLSLLKVIDLENVHLASFPDEITNIIHLRYLSLKDTRIANIPESLGKLTNLETLNLKGTFVSELPFEIQNLQRLRHLLGYHYNFGFYLPFNYVHGIKVGAGIGSIKSLQKLARIDANGIVGELANLTQMRRLGIVNLRREDGVNLCNSIIKMKNLRSFVVTSICEEEVLDLHSLLYPPPLLQRLYLHGRLAKLPNWISLLGNIAVIHLRWSRLRDDPFKALQLLPNLVNVTLVKAFDGEEICCMASGYPRLKQLQLRELSKLKKLRVEKGGMPNLEVLGIIRCEALVEVPPCLQYLTKLTNLNLIDLPEAFMRGLQKDGGEDWCKVQHIQTITCHDSASDNYAILP